ncbi:MAG: response regulator [Fimbriimonadaceae bacterium]|jgi:CheY-like chemotaxis protein|nr:response regulator [Fimbriimonadaceae bacterium]
MNPQRVAVIDDSAEDGDLILRALRECPVVDEAIHYLDPEQAVEALRTAPEQSPRLVLVDIKMPGLDGFSVIRNLRTSLPVEKCHFAVLSSSQDPEDVHRAHASGANTYLVKPVEFQQLKTMLCSLCDTWL